MLLVILGAGSGAGEAAATATGLPAGGPTVLAAGARHFKPCTEASSEAAKSLFNPIHQGNPVAGATGGLGAMANQPIEQEPIRRTKV